MIYYIKSHYIGHHPLPPVAWWRQNMFNIYNPNIHNILSHFWPSFYWILGAFFIYYLQQIYRRNFLCVGAIVAQELLWAHLVIEKWRSHGSSWATVRPIVLEKWRSHGSSWTTMRPIVLEKCRSHGSSWATVRPTVLEKCRSHGSLWTAVRPIVLEKYRSHGSNCEQPSVYKRFFKRANSENWLSPVIKATRKQELWNGQEARKGLFPSGGKFFVDVLMTAFEPGSKDLIPGAVARTLRRRIYTEKRQRSSLLLSGGEGVGVRIDSFPWRASFFAPGRF